MYSIVKFRWLLQSDYIKVFWISYLGWLSFKLYESFVRPNFGYEGTAWSEYLKFFLVCWISQFFGKYMMDPEHQIPRILQITFILKVKVSKERTGKVAIFLLLKRNWWTMGLHIIFVYGCGFMCQESGLYLITLFNEYFLTIFSFRMLETMAAEEYMDIFCLKMVHLWNINFYLLFLLFVNAINSSCVIFDRKFLSAC